MHTKRRKRVAQGRDTNVVIAKTRLKSRSPERPKVRELADSRKVRFLYGDFGVSQRTIAKLTQVAIASIERCVRENHLVFGKAGFGPYSEEIASDLARILRVTLPSAEEIENEDLWPRWRTFLRDALVKELSKSHATWYLLDGFLSDLPYRLRAAEARTTEKRLAFFASDLGMSTREIATVLRVAPAVVFARLKKFGITRWSHRHKDLDDQLLHELGYRVGTNEWPVDSKALSRWDRAGIAWQIAARRGILALAARGRLDLAVIDAFIEEIPKLAAEQRKRRERMIGKAKMQAERGTETAAA